MQGRYSGRNCSTQQILCIAELDLHDAVLLTMHGALEQVYNVRIYQTQRLRFPGLALWPLGMRFRR